MGQIGRFRAADQQQYPRGLEVVCRTERGLEVGKILSEAEADRGDQADGALLRGVSDDDQMMILRLQKNRQSAIAACNRLLNERRLSAVLLDVEHLFDGQSLYFYFLGDVDPAVESLTAELAETYESKVRFRKFTESLLNGCGPNCGTQDCSTGGCASCAIAGGCKSSASRN